MSNHEHDWLTDIIRREGAVLFSAHPSPEDLVRYTEAATELTADIRHGIGAHLRVCAECTDDCNRLRQATRELQEHGQRQGASAPPHTSAGWLSELVERLREWLAPVRLIPAVVAVAITVVVLGPRTDVPIVEPVGRAVVLRGDVERGALPAITPADDGHLALSFVLPATDAGTIGRCEVEIAAQDGSVVAHLAAVPAFDQYGTFVLNIDARDLAPGKYTLTARDRIGSRRFSFTLQQPDRASRRN